MNETPQIIVMVGMPASGKNTWIKNNQEMLQTYTIVELDWIRREIFGHQFHRPAEQFVIGMAKSFAMMLSSQNKNIVINGTGLTMGIRRDWLDMAIDFNYNTTIVFLNVNINICKERNNLRTNNKVPDSEIDRMFKIFQKPYYMEANKFIEIKE